MGTLLKRLDKTRANMNRCKNHTKKKKALLQTSHMGKETMH
jgi:hypothetical protein